MARTILFTGFPGFIGKRLSSKLLADDPRAHVICLVQSKFLGQARTEAERIRTELRLPAEQLTCTTGDITDPRLGLAGQYDDLCARVNEVWHLAAIYDLAVAEELARKVNVDGTRHVLAFCRACKVLNLLVHFSTAYVAGTRSGLVRENELIMGQSFKNNYEATKFAAEVYVRMEMDKGLPAIVIRPAIVVGDSRTGETDKFDGPYYAFKMLSKLNVKGLRVKMPLLGPSAAEANLVPVDFLVDATVALAKKRDAVGKTFHMADPMPLRAAELYDLACRLVLGRGAASYSVPAALAEKALHIDALRHWLGVPAEAVAYFNHKVKLDSSQTTALLEGTGVKLPRVREYFPVLYQYWLAHKDELGYAPKA